nr:oligosaccharide flippase family protein [Lacihabitans soyangensis]
MAFTFIGIKIISSKLGAESYGEISLYLTITMLVHLVFSGPFSGAIARFSSIAIHDRRFFKFESELIKFFIDTLKIALFLFIVAAVCLFNKSIQDYALLVIYSLLYSISYFVFTQVLAILGALRERFWVSFINILEKLFRFGLAYITIIFYNSNVKMVFLSFGVGLLLISITSCLIYYKLVREKIKKDTGTPEISLYKHELINYSLPFALFGIIIWLQNSSEKWFLDLFVGTKEVGIYSILNQVGFQTFVLLSGVITSMSTPIIFEKSSSISKKTAIRLNTLVTFFFIVIGIITIILSCYFGDDLIIIFSSSEFISKPYLLPIITISGVLFAIAQNISINYMILLKSKLLQYPKIISGIVGVFINYILTKSYGLDGLTFSILITNFLYLLILVIVQSYYLQEEIGD